MTDTGSSAPSKPELIVGLVGASGANLREAANAVKAALSPYGYETVPVRLSELMRAVKGGASLADIKAEEDRVWEHMDAGDEIRKQSGRNDAMAALGVGYIYRLSG